MKTVTFNELTHAIVPIVPTNEMISAARKDHEGEWYLPSSLYDSMLAAAPDFPAQPVPADSLSDFNSKLFAKQEQLGAEAAKILYENAWDLYAQSATDAPTPLTHAENVSKNDAEIDILRLDAARYRWLRNSGQIVAPSFGKGIAIPLYQPLPESLKELDAFIDVEMKGEKS